MGEVNLRNLQKGEQGNGDRQTTINNKKAEREVNSQRVKFSNNFKRENGVEKIIKGNILQKSCRSEDMNGQVMKKWFMDEK